MRRVVIRFVLPALFGLFPVLSAVVIAAAVPADAMGDYLQRVRVSPIDWLILGVGTVSFLAQMSLTVRALRWQGTGFDERPDKWLSHLAHAAEWFPLLGLIGTVAAILQTFSGITGPTSPQEIIRRYAPAITATGSGLFMALINILPTWTVNVGRDLILSLAGPMRDDDS